MDELCHHVASHAEATFQWDAFMEAWERDVLRETRKDLSHYGALPSTLPWEPRLWTPGDADSASWKTMNEASRDANSAPEARDWYFDAGNDVYAFSIQLLFPHATSTKRHNSNYLGDVLEAILGLCWLCHDTTSLAMLLVRASKYVYGLKSWLALDSFDHSQNRQAVYRYIAEHSCFRTDGKKSAPRDLDFTSHSHVHHAWTGEHERFPVVGTATSSDVALPAAWFEDFEREYLKELFQKLHLHTGAPALLAICDETYDVPADTTAEQSSHIDDAAKRVMSMTEEVLAPTTTLSCNTEPSGLRVCAEAFYEQEDTSLGSLEARGLLLDTTFASQGRAVAMDELSKECFACLRTDAVDSGVPTTAELADASQRGDPGTDDTVRQCLTPRTTNDGSCSWCDGTLQPAELHISNDGAPGLNHCADDDQTCFEGRSNASQGAHANAAIGEMRAANADVLSAPMCVSALLRCMLPEERDRSDQVQRFIKFAEEPSTAMSETLTPETNELIQGICIDLFWRRTAPDGALLQLADVNVFSELYRVRREVHRNDRAELTETDIKRCWKILYDEFMTTLSPQQSRYTTRQKHSLFHSSLKRRFGNKRFIFAVWQTGMTWLPEPWDMRPHAMVNALFAWCRRFRTAEREYLQRVNEANGTQPFRM